MNTLYIYIFFFSVYSQLSNYLSPNAYVCMYGCVCVLAKLYGSRAIIKWSQNWPLHSRWVHRQSAHRASQCSSVQLNTRLPPPSVAHIHINIHTYILYLIIHSFQIVCINILLAVLYWLFLCLLFFWLCFIGIFSWLLLLENVRLYVWH